MDLTVDLTRLRRLLGDPELAWLVDRARRRLAHERPLTGPVSLTDPTPAQRAAAERLLGRPPGRGRTLTIPLEAVDATLRRSGASPEGLTAAITALTGPVIPRSEARAAEDWAWAIAYAPLDDLPHLADWATRLRAEGLVRRLARTPETARELLTDTVTVLRALPTDPATSLPAFAARVLGSAHALDDGTPLATLTLSGVRALTGHPAGTGAEWRRAAWASAGLLRDDLSSTVLTLNLLGTPALDWHASQGEPAVLTLRQLAHRPPESTAGTVHVCENPAVLAAAADRHGPHCPPLVCLQGQPSAAALTLLRHLHDRGATLQYHGDFDWGGLRIANSLLRHVPFRPWRYTTPDYLAAADPTTSPPLTGVPVATPWDPPLATALTRTGVRVEEETVLDLLLDDLG
ncbi:TIGR02679 family protein [Streptomyces millisiae]|uniref:TIGR02679 family protein n=1 Tax=Streptomyces millisiae TaxID=3075542 RepID=A0ABU2LN05_9ACTN|nr:TIGR02679 family protein [Streptomyces sp. DSM 44918]MDT0318433.1 TIGR02679 family protein [Streptomyces sp. DSM 44918]